MAIPYEITHWHNQTSRNGMPGDVLNSMLQKSIRRADEENAMAAAYEMYITSPAYLDMLWLRLMCTSVEDVGFGDPDAPRLVRALNEIRREFPYADSDQPLFFIQAIRYLCRCRKERTSDHLANMLRKAYQNGFVPQVPDYACDMHTAKGRGMGRDIVHFAEEACRVVPQADDPEIRRIHAEFVDFCKSETEMAGGSAAEPFRMNRWQY